MLQRQPLAAAVVVKLGDIQRAIIQQRVVGLAVIAVPCIARDEFVDILELPVVAHINRQAAIVADALVRGGAAAARLLLDSGAAVTVLDSGEPAPRRAAGAEGADKMDKKSQDQKIKIDKAPTKTAGKLKLKAFAGCKSDVKKHCADIEPGEGRVRACLGEHSANLDKKCTANMERYAAGQWQAIDPA